ncbi:hypothetical protein HS048_29970 [Planomonospora sp. ID91781]|uniref:hypothetical protein n=1 Tax=Planomonospora sp. ID91781 TaxID=2738135 RepID=UPI0018C3ED27|nr:hypothetical protein [Planomonospora sp. ID91781]MBG0824929.1 hypothetical protein [Planomonospora sp. ID91781]
MPLKPEYAQYATVIEKFRPLADEKKKIALAWLANLIAVRFEFTSEDCVMKTISHLSGGESSTQLQKCMARLSGNLMEEFEELFDEDEDAMDEAVDAGHPLWRRAQAMEALFSLIAPASLEPYGEPTILHARLALGDEWPTVADELLEKMS